MGNSLSLSSSLDVHSSLAVQCLYAVFYLTMHTRKNTLVQFLYRFLLVTVPLA